MIKEGVRDEGEAILMPGKGVWCVEGKIAGTICRPDIVNKDPTPPVEMDERLRRLRWATGNE